MKGLKYLLLSLLFGCGGTPFEPYCSDTVNGVVKFEEFQIDIPLSGSSYDFTAIEYSSQEHLLYGLDAYSGKILKYDLNLKKMVTSIDLQSSGPDEVVDPYSMSVVSADSIFLLTTEESTTIYLINKIGKVLNKWRINYALPNGMTTATGNFSLMGIGPLDQSFQVVGDTLVALMNFGAVVVDSYTPKYNKPMLGFINLKNQEVDDVRFFHPENYRSAELIPHDDISRFDWTGSADWVIGFESTGIVYFSSADQYYCVQSNFDSGIRTFFERDEPRNESRYVSSYQYDDKYEGIHHDSVLGLTYRIFKKGDALGERHRDMAYWSIILIDNEGEVIGETELIKDNYYNFNSIAVIPGEGLLVSRENYNNPNNTEEILSFSLFTFDLDQK